MLPSLSRFFCRFDLFTGPKGWRAKAVKAERSEFILSLDGVLASLIHDRKVEAATLLLLGVMFCQPEQAGPDCG